MNNQVPFDKQDEQFKNLASKLPAHQDETTVYTPNSYNINFSDINASARIINYILHYNDFFIIKDRGYTVNDFQEYSQEYNYIMDYAKLTRIKDGEELAPPIEEFHAKFPDFPLYKPNDAPRAAIYDKQEQKLYSDLVSKVLNPAQTAFSTMKSFDVLTHMKQRIDEIYKDHSKGFITDIKSGSELLDEYIQDFEKNHGCMGISTGFKDQDKEIRGWKKDDLVIVLGGTNQGKSWICLKYAVEALKQKKRVAIFSGEMSSIRTYFRIHTLYANYGNTQLEKLMAVKKEDATKSFNDEERLKKYDEYKEFAKSLDDDLAVFTPQSLGRKFDVNQLFCITDMWGPDLWIIDQLSHMSDINTSFNSNKTVRYGNIANDLRAFVNVTGIPVILAHQAGKPANSDGSSNRSTRYGQKVEMESSYHSYEVAHNATKMISFTQEENDRCKIKIIKNSNGCVGSDFTYTWDKNYGIFTKIPSLIVDDNKKQNEMKKSTGAF